MPNDLWAMDFVFDRLFDARPFRILTIVDCHTRETLATSDGPEFAGRLLDQWAYLNKVELDFSRPGKPTYNANVKSYNRRASTPPGSFRWGCPDPAE